LRAKKKNRYIRAQGEIRWNPKGFAFIINSNLENDIFISERDLSGAVDGDIVEARATRDKKGIKGKVTSIVQRRVTTISGYYKKSKGKGLIMPFKPFPYKIVVPDGSENGAKDGDSVIVEISTARHKGYKDQSFTGRVIELLCIPDNVDDQVRYVAMKYGLPWLFSKDIEKKAKKVSKIDYASELKRRHDIRNRVLFTIDGRDAKDFDDAVGIERLPDSTYLLTVAISDVSNIVQEGDLLDKEALKRSFSVYFPGLTIHMLPKALSTQALSLNPGEDRLAMVVEARLGKRGKLIDYTCYEGIVHSRARLCYEDVGPFLEGKAALPVDDPDVLNALNLLDGITRHLYMKRKKKGSLDFDIPEAGIKLDPEGNVDHVFNKKRDPSEQLIEETMILTNKIVCKILEKHNMPALYRIHEQPSDKDLFELKDVLSEVGIEKHYLRDLENAVHDRKNLNHVLQNIADYVRDKDIAGFVHQQILRSLKQAQYSNMDKGHFGLACMGYLHFTSPIRRYPDIVIHRLLKKALLNSTISKKEHRKWYTYIKRIAPYVSQREKITDDAMLEVAKLKKTSYMARHIGDKFKGVVTGIMSYGIFVGLLNIPVEGLIPIAELGNARIVQGKSVRTKKRIVTIGGNIDVRVAGVDEQNGFIDLSLI